MASFYNTACRVDAKMALFQPELQKSVLDEGLTFYVPKEGDEQLSMPQSIMNDNVAVNYRTIYNGYPTFDKEGSNNFTEYDDYKKNCSEKIAQAWKNGSYNNRPNNENYKNRKTRQKKDED